MEPEDKIYAKYEKSVRESIKEAFEGYDDPLSGASDIAEDAAEAADAAIQELLYTASALAILGVDQETGEAVVSLGFNGLSAMTTDPINRTVPLSSAFLCGDSDMEEVEELIRAVEKTCELARKACALPKKQA